jgi:hypothetical protein
MKTQERWIYVVKLLSISTSKLNALLHLHIWPINLVVFQGTAETEVSTKPDLGEGFTLRCFQRLSFPKLAIQPCH